MSIEPEACAGKLDRVVQFDLPILEKNYSIRSLFPQHPFEIIFLKTNDLHVQCSTPFT